ncbi:unnamed protein product [Urochloa humidicola]
MSVSRIPIHLPQQKTFIYFPATSTLASSSPCTDFPNLIRFMEAAASFNIYLGYLDARTMGATQNLASSATSSSASSPRDSGEGRIPEPGRQREGSPIASRLRSLRRL